ncbi:hypothetical protein SCALM49S_01925 [Streptomyces californicus]
MVTWEPATGRWKALAPGALGGTGGAGLLLADLLGTGLGLALGLRLRLGLGRLGAGFRLCLGLEAVDLVGLPLLGVGLALDPVGDRGVEADGLGEAGLGTLADSVSAASAGEDSEPMTPVVARAAMPAARALRRVRRLGARCFPVARVNAMKRLILSFLLAYRVS